MAKLAGRFLSVQIDDSGGTQRDVSADVESVEIPLEYGEVEVTGFGEGGENSIPGMPKDSVRIRGKFNPAATTGLYTVAKGILGSYTSKTVDIRVGQNAAPTTGDPKFSGEFWLKSMNISMTPQGAVMLDLEFLQFGSALATWGTV